MFKRLCPIVLGALFASGAWAAAFTQADLEKMVKELDAVIPHNTSYRYPVQCEIVDQPKVNAYATRIPEGTALQAKMVVYTGLVKACDGDQRLIRAVVAHELSHLSRGHLDELDPKARDLRNLWTRQQEFEADKFGAEALVKTGHPRKDMVDMLLFLESRRSREGDWLSRLTADHADPKYRAAEVADDPSALKALLLYDTGLAYEDAREHSYAQKLFAAAGDMWPKLTEAYINSGKCALLFYYDHLPLAVRNSWWRPDFGPLITAPHVSPQAVAITDEDRTAWKKAKEAIDIAVLKNPGKADAAELQALLYVLEPDANKEIVQKGIDWFKSQMSTDEVVKLRYANNGGLGYQRLGDLSSAYAMIIKAQRSSEMYNPAVGENLGLVVVKNRSKADDELAANVMFTWLSRTPQISPRWSTVKKTFDEVCAKAGINAKPIESQPALLCAVTTLVTDVKRFGLFLPVSGAKTLLGEPEQSVYFDKKYPDMMELRWHSGAITMLTERNKVMRLTSTEPGAYLVLKPTDKTSTDEFRIKVGMTRAEFNGILDEKAGVTKYLAKGGKVDQWTYFTALNFGVLFDGDKVAAITVTPVQYEEEE